MFLPYARTACSRPGLTFAMIVKPWHAGVRGKREPYLPCSSLKYHSFGIAMASEYHQSFCLGMSDIFLSFRFHVYIRFGIFSLRLPMRCVMVMSLRKAYVAGGI